ncbi:hypothetical protein A2160_04850 [Candidatus Beckwithbacteria bacterium RBG_13_42_9]|uniref:Large ribosomal subunit protein bL25 n=1 Tax=Candidatus Beckwithbacteria bacterium RBG_13_42_9 TaxID=1797457 RepID=A0A1F5E5V1_9BACT|nr:MAG: hypothetical protein A2160_04850 [Candidatus Beckwithbacteria bacterium RBG_13_42_9]
MTKNPTLQVEKRELAGRKVKQLRRQGILPANVYGKKVKSQSVQVDGKTFLRIYDEVGETGLVELILKGDKASRHVLIHNVQQDPVSDLPLHVDFYQVDLTQKVTAKVPLEMTGIAPAVAKGGVLVQLLTEVEVEALPADLPDKLVIDVSKLEEMGNNLTAEDLKYDKAKVILKLEDPKTLVAQIEAPTKEEEKPVVEVAPEAVVAEGEAPKEGEKPQAAEAGKPAEEPAKAEK